MKYLKLSAPFAAALLAFMAFAAPLDVFAANGRLFMTPGGGNFAPGSTFRIEVRADTGSASKQITRASVKYPNHLLKATSSNAAGSDFKNGKTSINHGSGLVSFTSFDTSPPKGSNLYVYSIQFEVIGQGDAKVEFVQDAAISGGRPNAQPAQFRLYPTYCPVGQIGTPPNCSVAPSPTQPNPSPKPPTGSNTKPKPQPNKSSSNSSQAPTTVSLPPLPLPATPETDEPLIATEEVDLPSEEEAESFGIGNIHSKIMYDSVSVHWQSNQPAASTFYYGTSADTLDKRVDVSEEESTSFSSSLTQLKPGQKYYYAITSVSQNDATKSDSHKSSFTTKGYPVKIAALYNEEPLTEASLSLKNYSGSAITDEKGATILELKEGTYDAVIKKEGVTIEETIAVKALDFPTGTVPDTQNFTIKSTGSALNGSGSSLAIILTIGLLLAATGIVVAVIVIRKKRAQTAAQSYQSVVIDDWKPPTNTTYVNPGTGAFNIPPPPSYPQAPTDQYIPENEYFADLDKR